MAISLSPPKSIRQQPFLFASALLSLTLVVHHFSLTRDSHQQQHRHLNIGSLLSQYRYPSTTALKYASAPGCIGSGYAGVLHISEVDGGAASRAAFFLYIVNHLI
jgi:hypothetical protein